MSYILRVLWTLTPREAPRPLLACSSCGDVRPFHSSGKIRLNANGKRLDAWLIYRCDQCDETWNRPVFDRRSIRSLDPAVLAAASDSDQVFVAACAFDMEGLRRYARQIETSSDVAISKTVKEPARSRATALEIELGVALATDLRIDRLLSRELGMSRTRVTALFDRGLLTTNVGGKNALRRSVKDGVCIMLELSGVSDAAALLDAAAGLQV